MSPERLSTLIDKYLHNTASPEEEQELNAWYHAANQQEVEWEVADENEARALKALLLSKLQQNIQSDTTVRTIPFYRRTAWKAAAAIIIIVGGVTSWLLISRNRQPVDTAAATPLTKEHTIVPGGNKAMLTLADGSTIVLDSAGNTTLATQGSTHIIKLNNGQLAYRDASNNTPTTALQYNKIVTPKGGQYEIILPDGSHAWLNAASSLRFPAAFTGNQRMVELTGEAYFEVAKNPAQPFIVTFSGSAGDGQVEVLGTHFNINAYNDESNSKTTLLEGKVKISSPPSEIQHPSSEILSPGQQATIAESVGNIKVQAVDADAAIAWKNGVFVFDKVDIKTVMRQIARWYDVEVVYEGAVSIEKFEGEIPRSSTLTDVFKILELSSVHFRIEGRKVIVMP